MAKKAFGSLFVLLLAGMAIVAVQRSSEAAVVSHSPQIVANVALMNQSAPSIPLTILFTPTKAGLYRITTYATVTQPGPLGGSRNEYFSWTDDAGAEATGGLAIYDNAVPPNAFMDAEGNNAPGAVMTIQAVAGKPVQYQVIGSITPPPVSTYSLYITAERLQ